MNKAASAHAAASADKPEIQVGLTGRPLRELPDLRRLTGMAQRQSWRCVTKKGGVGKTTSTINLGACLAEAGRRVLLVDLDPQGALSAGLGIPHDDLDLTIYNLLVDNRTTILNAIHQTPVQGLDLVPANIDLSAAEIQLVNEVGREQTPCPCTAPSNEGL